MFALLFHHPLIAFVLWTLLAVGFGLLLGKVIDHADTAQQHRVGTDTEVIDWNDAPREWVL